MPVPFGRADKGGYRDVWTVGGLEPVPRRWKGEGKGRGGKGRRDKRRRVSSRTVAGRSTGQGRAKENSFIMDAVFFFFKKRREKMQRRRGYY